MVMHGRLVSLIASSSRYTILSSECIASKPKEFATLITSRKLHFISTFRKFSCFNIRNNSLSHNKFSYNGYFSNKSTSKSMFVAVLRLSSNKSSPVEDMPHVVSNEKSSIKSVWKSSQKTADSLESAKYREQLYRKINLDVDYSHIKDELPLYEMTNFTLYRVIFTLVIAQYIFWIFCANVLFMFYSGIDAEGNKLRDLYTKNKQEDKKASFLKTCTQYITANGYQTLVQVFFVLVGNIFAAVIMFLLTRCVSFIRLMPGGKQVKIGTLNVFGGYNPKRFSTYNINDISSVEHRLQNVNYISLRLKGKTISYLLDRQGKFSNEKIYDHTVGVKRNLKN